MTVAAIITLLTGLIGFLAKVWPEPKTPEQVARDKIKDVHDTDTTFEKTGDTRDLGRLP